MPSIRSPELTTSSTQHPSMGPLVNKGVGVDNTSRSHGQLCWAHDWLTAEHDIVHVPIASLQPGESLRLKGESKDHTRSIVEAVEVPPIIVHQPTMRVVDGRHRLQAAILRDQEVIEAWLFDGTAEEAFVLAVAANVSHGLALTTKDRKIAAARILGMYPDWSDRAIAATTGLSNHTVAAVRRKCSGGQFAHLNRRRGRDGKIYPPNSNAGRQAAAELIRTDHNASARQIARQAGVSVGTAHNARARLPHSVEPMVPTTHGAGLGFHLARAKEILRGLWNDPAVRSHDKGKAMLDLLSHSLRITVDAQAAIKSAPEHCRNAMAEYAAACGDSWHHLAKDLRSKIQTG